MFRYDGLEMPDRVKNAPEVYPGLELYYQAWMDLHSSRPQGFGPCPIQWNMIREYAVANEFDLDQTAQLHHALDAMDQVYLAWADKKSTKNKKIGEQQKAKPMKRGRRG